MGLSSTRPALVPRQRRRRALASAAPLLLAALGAGAGGCADPVREREIAALGGEDPAQPPGPLHRPNQPCLVCHDAAGPARPMTVGGTIYRDHASTFAAAGADVLLTDGARESFITRTNCAGNFFVFPETFRPTLPIWVTLRAGDRRIDMESPLHKNGDCGACHQDPASPSQAGHVFLEDAFDPTAAIVPAGGDPCAPETR